MKPIRARVQNGRLVIDGVTDLPEGTVLDLVPADALDALDEADRRALHDALGRSAAEAREGKGEDADVVLKRLRTGE